MCAPSCRRIATSASAESRHAREPGETRPRPLRSRCLERVVDETLDREAMRSAIALLDALLDPLPDVRSDADMRAAQPRDGASTPRPRRSMRASASRRTRPRATLARKRVRELGQLLAGSELVAETRRRRRRGGAARASWRTSSDRCSPQLPEMRLRRGGGEQRRAKRGAGSRSRRAWPRRPKRENSSCASSSRERRARSTRCAKRWKRGAAGSGASSIAAAVVVAAIYAIPYAFGRLRAEPARRHLDRRDRLDTLRAFSSAPLLQRIAPIVRNAREACRGSSRRSTPPTKRRTRPTMTSCSSNTTSPIAATSLTCLRGRARRRRRRPTAARQASRAAAAGGRLHPGRRSSRRPACRSA